MNKYPITVSGNGMEVYVNLINSPAAVNINHQPYLLALIKEVLGQKSLRGEKVVIEHDMGRDIGNTDVVETSEKDTIFYARPVKQDVYLRCVKNFTRSLTSYITVTLERNEDGSYTLQEAWIGRLVPPFPAESGASKQNKTFWDNHAWQEGSHPLQAKTITKVSPYEVSN